MSVDAARQVITEERCRNCGAPASAMHPAGVIADSNWKCTRCKRRQHDVKTTTLEGND